MAGDTGVEIVALPVGSFSLFFVRHKPTGRRVGACFSRAAAEALLTVFAFVIAAIISKPSTAWYDTGTGIFYYPASLIIALTVWLIWALLR